MVPSRQSEKSKNKNTQRKWAKEYGEILYPEENAYVEATNQDYFVPSWQLKHKPPAVKNNVQGKKRSPIGRKIERANDMLGETIYNLYAANSKTHTPDI